jgi:hypothetical protein
MDDVAVSVEVHADRLVAAMEAVSALLLSHDRYDLRPDGRLHRAEADLERIIFDYILRLKDSGLPPERVLVAVKQVALRFERAARKFDVRLSARVISRCIEEYYRS